MAVYRIENLLSGHVFGEYEGATEQDAIDAMMNDAGCDADADDSIKATRVDAHLSGPTVECAYCSREVPDAGDAPVPALTDDAEWSRLAAHHAPDCEWIATRAHRRLARG